MLKFSSTTILAAYEPPRPTLIPRARKDTIKTGAVGHNADFVEDWGLANNRHVRFVSSENQGFVTPTQVTALNSLYEAGAPFTLETDLLGPLTSAAVTYTARFEPGSPPTFTQATPSGSHWRFDISVII